MQHYDTKQIGVISDTHGLLRPEVLPAFQGVKLILHAGDIGSPEVLYRLRTIAPVVAVRGNNDIEAWARRIPESKLIESSGVYIYMLHDLKMMKRKISAGNFQVVISGHSHRPCIEEREGVLFINPGSAGPRRFKLPVSVARLEIEAQEVRVKFIEL
jgi:putative phosphoesterase